VNETFARRFDPGGQVVGKRMRVGRDGPLNIEIVGVARDAKYKSVRDTVPPMFYTAYRQESPTAGTFYVRTRVDPASWLATVPAVMAMLDSSLPIEEMRTMSEQLRVTNTFDRLLMTVSTSFAVLATVLAAIGLYGVLAYTVVQRTREIGLRMALGAAPARVRRMVLGQVGRMTIIGGIVGLSAAWGLSRLAQSLLYNMTGSDPIVLVGSVAALSLVALAAGFVPALKASRVEPMRALRYE
jgi:ABC-type antimicrobial peptide transport system permease subunit